MMETSTKNAQAILELHQEIAGCVAVKTTVDDIKTRQLMQIWENIMRVANGLDDMTTRYSNLTENIPRPLMPSIFGWITSFARAYPPRRLPRTMPRHRHPWCAMRLLLHRLCSLMAFIRLHRLMWSQTRPQHKMGDWTRMPPRICLAPMPRTDACLITHVTQTDPICPGIMTLGIREVLHPSNGAHI